jgi:hypothetical protein
LTEYLPQYQIRGDSKGSSIVAGAQGTMGKDQP